MRQQDIEKLATKVLGWKKCGLCRGFCKHNYVWTEQWGDNCPEHSQHLDREWNPFESWNDAGMVFEATGAASMALARAESKLAKARVYVCILIFDDTSTFHADSPDGYPAAIAEAALKVCDG